MGGGGKNPSDLHKVARIPCSRPLTFIPPFLNIRHSTCAGLHRSVLELHRAETIPSASQVQAIYKQLPQNSFWKVSVVQQVSRQRRDGDWQQYSRRDRLSDDEAGLIPTLQSGTRIILCSDVTVVDAEHSVRHKTCFFVHGHLCKTLPWRVRVVAFS